MYGLIYAYCAKSCFLKTIRNYKLENAKVSFLSVISEKQRRSYGYCVLKSNKKEIFRDV